MTLVLAIIVIFGSSHRKFFVWIQSLEIQKLFFVVPNVIRGPI